MVQREGAAGPGAPLLVVADTLAGLTALGAAGRARFAGRLVAITGSVGKTTTKEMLRTILAAQAPTHAARASHNNHWGVPLTLALLPPGAAFCVAEIGMNHAGEIAPLARLARPHVAVITAIAAAHIGHLGSIEAIADEKAAILLGLEPGGAAVLPADTALLPRLRAAARAAGVAHVVTFGADPGADVRLISAAADDAGTDLRGSLAGETITLRLAAPGRHMALNALAALAAAVALGVPAGAAARGAGRLRPAGRPRGATHPRGARRQRAAAGRELQRQRRLDARGARRARGAAGRAADRGAGRHAGTRRRTARPSTPPSRPRWSQPATACLPAAR